MRNLDGMFDVRAVNVGTIAYNETHYGTAIDTRGFRQVLATLTAGAIGGTNGNTGVLSVKFQEGNDPSGTGTAWTDITNEGVTGGSFAFDDLTVHANSSPLCMGKAVCLIDANRSRYIRCLASLAGTDSVNVTYAVNVLMGYPADSLYITDGSTVGTANSEFSQ